MRLERMLLAFIIDIQGLKLNYKEVILEQKVSKDSIQFLEESPASLQYVNA